MSTDSARHLRIVAGAGGLVGLAVTRRLLTGKGDTWALERSARGLEAARALFQTMPVREGELRVGREVDLLDSGACARLFGEALGEARYTHAELYLCAGDVGGLALLSQVSVADFRKSLEDNLVLAYTVAREFALAAIAQAIPASITLAGSVGGQKAHRYKVGYDAAKAGVEGMARAFAVELGSQGVRTNVIAVGPIAESPSTAADGSRLSELVRLVPAARYASADEVAAVFCAVGSSEWGFLNGETIAVDGGLSFQLRPVQFERGP
jgi:NAD(P)-dependent dehydrogenase (short-subunit alcohol dehydrogenase family)